MEEPQKESISNNHDELAAKLLQAAENAPPQKEIDSLAEEQQKTIASFLCGELPVDEYNRRLQQFSEKSGYVDLLTYAEFKYALIILFDAQLQAYSQDVRQRMVQYYLEHENAHLATALSRGLTGTYTIQFKKMESGKVEFQPAVKIAVPSNFPPERIQELTREFLSAPDELSPSDLAQLGLEKK